MQTRKRAKSVSFGKKEKKEHEASKEKEVIVAAEKAEEKEEKTAHEVHHEDGLSDVPPKADEKEDQEFEITTPESEFVTDSSPVATAEAPKTAEEPVHVQEPHATQPTPQTAEEAAALSTSPDALSAPEQPAQQAQPAQSGELSPTLPPSAFTIQNEESPASVAAPDIKPEGEKKHFGRYFLIVASTAFILGLGAMAVVSYFGFFNTHISGLPQIPMFGAKQTPTTVPPTATPTSKPVNLTAFTISVLNGSGVAGKAADVKTSLTTAGYKVTTTGNAATSDFTKTEIAAKKSVDSAFLTKLEIELKKSYMVDSTVTTAPASSTTDVTVTLGQPTAQ